MHEIVGPISEASKTPRPLHPSRVLAGRRLCVVGGTGFLGKVWVSMLLHRFPDIAHLYLLVRPKEDQTAEERFWSQIAPSAVFDPVREQHPGPAFEAFLREKITPIAGDLVEPLLGIDEGILASLEGKVEAVVNVAGVVDFNPPLDEALEANAFGVNNLASLARRLNVPVLHTSTCYVAGYRSGLIEEVDPREVPFPRAEGETWYGSANPDRTLDRSHWDPQREIDECLDLVKQARQRADDAFRQSAFLDRAKENLRQRGEPCRGAALTDELAKVRRSFIKDQLIEAGQERASFWGWTNIYTYTKSIGEQVLAASGVRFTIVRPAVIESSMEYPFCGWNEGINTSAPYLYMVSKGQVQFPGSRDVHLDIIPVDMVTSGMIASLCELLEGTAPTVYQYGTTDTNPCSTSRYMELAGLYKRRQVFEGKKTKLFDLVSSRVESIAISKKQYETHGARKIATAMRGLGALFDLGAHGALRPILRPASDALVSAAKAEDKTAEILELFVPFVAEADWIFSCENTRAVMNRMPPEERARFFWEPEKIDWRSWMWDVHLPGLEKWVFPLIEERLQRELKPLRAYDTLLDMLDEMAERHDHAVALQQLGPDGLSRVSFRELSHLASLVAARLVALDVRPRDRVILSGLNQPAWPIAYFGILRAGAVAVPVDPALEGAQLANVIRSSGAKVALWDAEVEKKGGPAAKAAHPGLRVLDLPGFVFDEDVSDDALAAPDFVATESDLASVIYTSGTSRRSEGRHACTATSPRCSPRSRRSSCSRERLHPPGAPAPPHLRVLLRPACSSRAGRAFLYLDELNAERLGEGRRRAGITGMGVPALWQMPERKILSRAGGSAAESWPSTGRWS
ncbi:MAG: SDR family oxidoreductase [Byssovorax sp.]